jgi:D-alanyl-lipoteichoic acid acyltransferase DltB (MBOAT superfamily)
MRWADFRGQVDGARWTGAQFERAAFVLTMGLGKKLLVADWLARVGDPLWSAGGPALGLRGAWTALLAYHFRIYFDFSGYSDIAIGLALLLGVRVPANFDAPYAARSPTDFWQRWHMTLSAWFRDYLFFPLSRALLRHGGSRHPDLTRAVSLVATMTLVGLWHGPTAGMAVWGAYHGVLLAGSAQMRSLRWPGWGRPATAIAVLLGWVLFRSDSLAAAGRFYASLVGVAGWGNVPLPGVDPAFVAALVVLAALTNLQRDTVEVAPRRTALYAAAMAAVAILSLMSVEQPMPFLYFQF